MTALSKKLIEVALPLEAINRESAREKSIRHGHPSTLHLWWARRPLATCRAVLFASLVDDPSGHPDQFASDEAQEAERQRLFRIIEDLVRWDNSANETVLAAARAEIMRSTDGNPPPVLDPFCGGGSIPLEAERLGLEVHASDLNPVAVLITKAMIEIPPRFANQPPVNPASHARLANSEWRGAQGLAEDVRYYGRWMREEAEKTLGHLYPKLRLSVEQGGGEATVIAWIWARTVKCQNPACDAEMPLVRSFALSTKKGKQAWVEPVIDPEAGTLQFEVRTGTGVAPQGTVSREGARCLLCGGSTPLKRVRSMAKAGQMSAQLMAIVAKGDRGRIFASPDAIHREAAASASPSWGPEELVTTPSHDVDRLPMYGMTRWRDAFTDRQLVALTTFSDLVGAARERIAQDAVEGRKRAGKPIEMAQIEEYANAVATYLALTVSKASDYWSSLCVWRSDPKNLGIGHVFARQALQMVWDYAEANVLSDSSGNWLSPLEWLTKSIEGLPIGKVAKVDQLDAAAAMDGAGRPMISTDPPYYDNIGYADLSDFFYVWLRRSLRHIYPTLFSTLLTPKTAELVASPHRFGGDRKEAQAFFERSLGSAFGHMRAQGHPAYPLTVYYAFKQSESHGAGDSVQVASTGWETMLSGLLTAGFSITGTWPMRSEMSNRTTASGTNALASSVVLVCRPRELSAPLASRREFVSALKAELPDALRTLQRGNIAPVDLAQASIGPGMAIFSRYARVLEADGSAMTIRAALALINQALDEVVAEQEGEFDADTRWAISWFHEVGMEADDFGRAELLSKAKVTSVQGMREAGILEAKAGKVRLLGRSELDASWDPATDKRLTVWEMTQHLIRRLEEGEVAAAELARQLGSNSEVARDLAYRLYLICERKKWAQEALAYNALVVAWPQIQRLAAAEPASAGPSQTSFEV